MQGLGLRVQGPQLAEHYTKPKRYPWFQDTIAMACRYDGGEDEEGGQEDEWYLRFSI